MLIFLNFIDMKIFKHLKKQAMWYISSLIYVSSVIMFFLASAYPYSMENIVAFVSFISLPIITFMLVIAEPRKFNESLRFGIKSTCFFMTLTSFVLSVLFFLGISAFMSSFCVIFLYGLLILKHEWIHVVMCFLVFWVAFLAIGVEKEEAAAKERNERINAMERETVIVDIVDKADPSMIKVVFKDKRIFTFEEDLGQKLLKSGDTVQVVILDHKIVRLER